MTTQTIYMSLLDEGTDCWAPVQAEQLDDGRFRVIGPMPEDQLWRYRPGTIVDVECRTFSGGSSGLAAIDDGNL
jgi:hypothetical protein